MDINLSILFNHKKFKGLLQTYKMMGVIILDDFKLSLDAIPDEVWDMIIKEGEG